MKKELSIRKVQWLFWILLFGINMITLLRFDTLFQALGYSFLMVTSFMIIVYGNANWLIPTYYVRGKYFIYGIAAILLILIAAFYRSILNWWFYNAFFAKEPTPFLFTSVLATMASSLLVYIASILLFVSRRYIRLKEEQQELVRKQTEAELKLLKAQVQPHFLFNVLNNIYFHAQREAPNTAALLEKLSVIMRYFVDAAPKDRIPLATEIAFVNHYISLETMRMRYPLQSKVNVDGEVEGMMVPPMLLITLVENVFKHGIDKRREDNFLDMHISATNGILSVVIRNRIAQPATGSGTGLANLEGRLQLLFPGRFRLQTGPVEHEIFESALTITL